MSGKLRDLEKRFEQLVASRRSEDDRQQQIMSLQKQVELIQPLLGYPELIWGSTGVDPGSQGYLKLVWGSDGVDLGFRSYLKLIHGPGGVDPGSQGYLKLIWVPVELIQPGRLITEG